ncbi:MAG TPA: hypothetical protein VK859_07475, partial [bacterium]|nr:hypothetical protein [bacterium]
MFPRTSSSRAAYPPRYLLLGALAFASLGSFFASPTPSQGTDFPGADGLNRSNPRSGPDFGPAATDSPTPSPTPVPTPARKIKVFTRKTPTPKITGTLTLTATP